MAVRDAPEVLEDGTVTFLAFVPRAIHVGPWGLDALFYHSNWYTLGSFHRGMARSAKPPEPGSTPGGPVRTYRGAICDKAQM